MKCLLRPILLRVLLCFTEAQPDSSLSQDRQHIIQDGNGWFVPTKTRRRNLRSREQFSPQSISQSQPQFHPNRRLLTTGTFHNLVLLLRFSSHSSRSLPPRSHYDLLYNSPTAQSSIVPTGSVKAYYNENSYGAFSVKTTVVGWITLSESEEYYSNGDYGFTKLKEGIVEALDALQNKPDFDLSEFDSNGDGIVDGFGILHSGYGAEFGGADCFGTSNVNRIWSHKGGVDWISSNNITVDRYYVSSGLRNKCGSDIVRMGVICHELGHYLGLPDLYDATFEGSGVGAYDVMSQSWGFDGTGMYPPYLSAWSKVSVGWVTPTVIEEDGTYQIAASHDSDAAYRIDTGFPNGEYLLIENRQQNGFDSKLPHGGLAVWHIDENANQDVRGYPDQDEWPENGKHYKVALLSADGNYDLERGVNQGDVHDLWHALSANKELRSGGNKFPNTDTYQDGVVNATGTRIYGFSASNNVMSFKVEGIIVQNETDAPSKVPSVAPSHNPMTDSPTALPSRHPTSFPVTQAPVTSGPSKNPTSSPSQNTGEPTESPSKQPVAVITTTSPTKSPISESERCADRCFEPLPASECPANGVFVNCKFSFVGGLCDSDDGECGTDPNLNNCYGHDVYRRVECEGSVEAVAAVSPPASEAPTRSPSHIPTGAPSSKPTVLIITGNSSFISSTGSEGQCMYYPGWSVGLNYCLNDCISSQPGYMDNSRIFEFTTIDLCCEAHYQGKQSCKEASANASSGLEDIISTDVELASVGGKVCEAPEPVSVCPGTDIGVQGVMIDLYECDYHTWVKGTRTNGDGSYLLSRIPPGRQYFLKITAPNGYVLSLNENWTNQDHDAMTATSSCHEILPLEDNTHFDVSVVSDSIETELVSAVDTVDLTEPKVYSPTHTKTSSANEVTYAAATHNKSSRGSAVSEEVSVTKAPPAQKATVAEEPQSIDEPIEELSLHSKSFVRGSTESDAVAITVQSTVDVTISQLDVITVGNAQDLRASKDEYILLKFDTRFLDEKKPMSAFLRLYSLVSSPVGGIVHFVPNDAWDEDSVTWDNAPDASDALGEIGRIRPNEWTEVDITGALNINQDDYISLRIRMSSSDSHWSAKYSSKESPNAQFPQLRVNF